MALYVEQDALEAAVTRLSDSGARPSLCDFLILKYAMAIGDGTVTLSLQDSTYMAAVQQLTAAHTDHSSAELPAPFFNPFGAARDNKRGGWRTGKYPSNGPPDTVNGPNWKNIISVLSEGPRRVEFTTDYVEHLSRVVVISDGQPPAIEDCAIWFFRVDDLEDRLAGDASVDDLTAAFIDAVGLTSGERAVIFEGE